VERSEAKQFAAFPASPQGAAIFAKWGWISARGGLKHE
jgi:ABC-type molybdate transport system substrate-binding protein